MEKNKRNEQSLNDGITLIALVITIIVLLILAGVSIAMLTGENGILTQSKQAKVETAKGGLKEEINLMIQKRKIDEETGRKVSLKEDLENEISGEKVIEEIEGVTDACYLTKESQTVTVYEDGTIVEGKIIWDGVSKTKPEIDSEGNWHIKGANELKFFEEFVNGKLSEEEKQGINIVKTTTIYLENHIDLGARQENGIKTRGTNWEPIGKANQFLGIFDGNNYTIRGMYVDQANNFAGLFGKANEIKNLTLKDSYVIGGNCIGGMAGIGHKIENSHNENTTVISREGNYYTIGGLVGQLNEKMENCSNTGKVIANGKSADNGNSYCGGLVGQTNSKQEVIIKNCTNQGEIIGNGNRVGGVVGMLATNSKVENCNNQGKVTGKGERVGGIAGQASTETIIKESKNSGEIVGESRQTGGIAGLTGANIEKSENQGKVIGKGERVGGIVGDTGVSAVIKECKNSGEVVGENQLVGGIVGALATNATIEKSENKGKVTGKGNRVGGIAGNANIGTTIKECKNSGEILGESQTIGGIVGWTNGNIEKNENQGKVTGKGNRVGGIVGDTGTSAVIKECKNRGEILGENEIVGGISGVSWGTIEKCENQGKVTGKGEMVGGIVGTAGNDSNLNIKNSYNSGEIIGESGKAGGIIGSIGEKAIAVVIKNNYNIGKIISTKDNKGGILGENEASSAVIENNYYLKGTSESGNGTNNQDEIGKIEQKEEQEMKTEEFANKLNAGQDPVVWKGSNGNYPVIMES